MSASNPSIVPNTSPADQSNEIKKNRSADQPALTHCTIEDYLRLNGPNFADWDSPEDRANPQNWPASKKLSNVAVVSFITLNTSLNETMFSPTIGTVMRDFDNDNELLSTFTISIYVLGFALAPLVLAPLSELYGRLYLYHVCGVLFVLTTVGCALSNSLSMPIVFRPLADSAGACPLGAAGGTLSDLFFTTRERRFNGVIFFRPTDWSHYRANCWWLFSR
jgi:hypothetical protein